MQADRQTEMEMEQPVRSGGAEKGTSHLGPKEALSGLLTPALPCTFPNFLFQGVLIPGCQIGSFAL